MSQEQPDKGFYLEATDHKNIIGLRGLKYTAEYDEPVHMKIVNGVLVPDSQEDAQRWEKTKALHKNRWQIVPVSG